MSFVCLPLVLFILIRFLVRTKTSRCCWKCAIIKVALIGDMETFCSAQIIGSVMHNAWLLCAPFLSTSLLLENTLLCHQALSFAVAPFCGITGQKNLDMFGRLKPAFSTLVLTASFLFVIGTNTVYWYVFV